MIAFLKGNSKIGFEQAVDHEFPILSLSTISFQFQAKMAEEIGTE